MTKTNQNKKFIQVNVIDIDQNNDDGKSWFSWEELINKDMIISIVEMIGGNKFQPKKYYSIFVSGALNSRDIMPEEYERIKKELLDE